MSKELSDWTVRDCPPIGLGRSLQVPDRPNMSDSKSRRKPQAPPQGRSLDPLTGALSKQALSKRAALMEEVPGRATRSRRSGAKGLPSQSEDAFRLLFDILPHAIDLRVSEARFRDLTELSTDWFWEQDENYRFTMLSGNLLKHTGVDAQSRLGKSRWDIPALNLSASDWEAHRAVLDARQPFFNFEIRRPDCGGQQIWVSVSGKPLFDSSGKFQGYRGIGRDISDRKRAESDLLRLNAELEARVAERTTELARSNEELESYSYTMAHDMRAPLRVILGFGRILLEDHGNRLPADALANLQRVLASADRMHRMIDGLLQLARLTPQPLTPADVDIAVLSRDLLAELAGAGAGRSVQVVVPESLPAKGDVVLLRIALQNLLGNAWKFSSGVQQARIEIGEAQTGHGRAFFVRDNGAGFDMAYAGKLFKVFQRLHSSSEFEGTGVGLASVERIIRRHGGRVWAESAPDQGATFFFTLPLPR